MSETGELPCLYCGTEPPPTDEFGFRTCCLGGRHVDQAEDTIRRLADTLNYYADPRHYEPHEVIEGGRRFANYIEADQGDQAAHMLESECRFKPEVFDRRQALRPAVTGDEIWF